MPDQWNSNKPSSPLTLQQWMNYVDGTLEYLSTVNIGVGAGAWYDAEFDDRVLRYVSSFMPGWRRLDDGRIELRGRLQRIDGAPFSDNELIMKIPHVGSPPCNETVQTSLTLIVPCDNVAPNVGVCRVDVAHEKDFKKEPVLRYERDENGDPVLDENGDPVTYQVLDGNGVPVERVVSMTEIRVRTPGRGSLNGWIGFDNVFYDPYMYIDALPPVAIGENPLVDDPGYVLVQHGPTEVGWYVPGVDYSES